LPKTVEESGRACRKHGWGLKADLYCREAGLIFEKSLSALDLFYFSAYIG
jgi:hypothetical protein